MGMSSIGMSSIGMSRHGTAADEVQCAFARTGERMPGIPDSRRPKPHAGGRDLLGLQAVQQADSGRRG